MASAAVPAGRDKVQILHGVLHSWGHDAQDFEFEEDHSSALAQLFGLVGGVVIVRRRSTGEERVYAAGSGSTWVGSVLTDLSRGHFAPKVVPIRHAA